MKKSGLDSGGTHLFEAHIFKFEFFCTKVSKFLIVIL